MVKERENQIRNLLKDMKGKLKSVCFYKILKSKKITNYFYL